MSDQTSAWPACQRASTGHVLASGAIDLLVVLTPLVAGVFAPLPASARLLLVLSTLPMALTLLYTHCLYGQGVGAKALGLRTVDDEAGLPPGSPRALLAVLRGGHAPGTTVYNVRQGPDPSRGTLASLTSPAATGDPALSPEEPRRTQRRSRKADTPERSSRRTIRQQTPLAPAAPLQGTLSPASSRPYTAPAYGLAPNERIAFPNAQAAPDAGRQSSPMAPAAPNQPLSAPTDSGQQTQYGAPPQVPALTVISPNGWKARITAATVVGRGPLPNPEHAAYATLAVPDLGRNCAANHIVLRPTMTGAEVTDLGSPTGTALLPPGAPPVFCPPGGTLAAAPPFSLALGSLTLTIAQE